MKRLGLTAANGLTVCVEIPDAMEVPAEWPLLAAAYVVGAQAATSTPHPDILLTLEKNSTPFVREVPHGVVIGGSWGKDFPADIYHILHTLTRAAWMKQGLYAAHAACVVVNGRVVLLAGPSGSGKSTIALALMRQGAAVFSGNTTLLGFAPEGGLHACAGTDVLTLPADAPDAAMFKGCVHYGNRVAARFPPPPPGPLDVDAIAIVRLNDGVQEARRLGSASALHTLYPVLMDAVNADVIVGEGVGVVSPSVLLATRAALAAELAQCLPDIPVWHFAGSLDHVIQCLEEGL